MNFIFEWVKTIFYERAHRVIERLFFTTGKKFISSSHRVIFFLLYGQEYSCTNNRVRAGNGVIDILTSEDQNPSDILNSEDMENTPLESRM